MSQALVALYENDAKPQKAVDFLKAQLGAPTPEDMAALQAEKDEVTKQLEESQVSTDINRAISFDFCSCGYTFAES